MKRDTTKPADDATEEKLFDNCFDPVETGLRAKVRGFIETMIEEELNTALSRPRYGRRLELTAADNAACADCRPLAWSSDAIADRHIRADPDCRPACPDHR
jgi:hypothetical protein